MRKITSSLVSLILGLNLTVNPTFGSAEENNPNNWGKPSVANEPNEDTGKAFKRCMSRDDLKERTKSQIQKGMYWKQGII